MKHTMTLGDFRRYTEHLSDDIELKFAYAGGNEPIRTFSTEGNQTLVLVKSNWMVNDLEGIMQAITFLKRKEDKK